MKTNKYIVYLLTFIFSICLFPTQLTASTQQKEAEKIDVKEIVLGHIGDEYHWHITKVGETHLSIPLPIIVYSKQTGWNIFSSSHLTHSLGDKYNGFYIAQRGANKDKLCETIDGQEVRPIDISITKNVLQLWIVVFIMLGVFLSSAHWYKKKNVSADAPRGFVGFIELFVMMVNDDIIKAGIGEKYYRPYAPYLLTTFFFVFTSNLIGLIPIFPGGANLTGNIAITMFLSLCTFIAINIFGNKEYWLDIFWPKVPIWLKFPIPMMPVIEFFGILTKPFALMVRLFANIFAGHAIVLSLVCVIFISCQLGALIGASLSFVSVVMTMFMDCLELLVAFIQAYVFTMLSAVFIGLAHQEEKKAI